MRKLTYRSRNIDKRAVIVMGIKAMAFTLLSGRLFYLQKFQKEKYSQLSNRNRLKIILTSPERGDIFDCNGVVLAKAQQMFRVHLIRHKVQNVRKILTTLGKFIALSDIEIDSIVKKSKRRRRHDSILIKENLNWKEMSRISVNSELLPGIEIVTGETREYLFHDTFSHTVGYVGKVSRKDVKKDSDPLLLLPGFETGKTGIERTYENILRGKPGTEKLEVDARGRIIRRKKDLQKKSGKDVSITIDSRLQTYVQKLLRPHFSASLVVLDVNTGAIKAMYSEPSFDANLFVGKISEADWQGIKGNKYHPLINKSLQGQYAPGSVFKMMVALAAQKKGASEKTKFKCEGYSTIFNKKFHCWKKRGHGFVDLKISLRESCDIWYYKNAITAGVDAIADMAKEFGLGQVYALGLGTQSAGLIPTKKWKKQRLGEIWYKGETVITGIGQGYALATPLQLAVMTARIASGGKKVEPHLVAVDALGNKQNTDFEDISVDKEHLNIVKEGMYEVVNHEKGTARYSKPKHWKMAGKTGTAQVRRISKAERETGVLKNDELEWESRDHALFVGYAPFDNPKYAVACVVEHGGSGSVTAAPIVKKVFDKLYTLEKMDGILPLKNQEKQSESEMKPQDEKPRDTE